MNHDELAERLEKRLDNIEKKLDNSLEQMTVNKTDINWLKGYVKSSIAFLVTLSAGVVTSLFNIFK